MNPEPDKAIQMPAFAKLETPEEYKARLERQGEMRGTPAYPILVTYETPTGEKWTGVIRTDAGLIELVRLRNVIIHTMPISRGIAKCIEAP